MFRILRLKRRLADIERQRSEVPGEPCGGFRHMCKNVENHTRYWNFTNDIMDLKGQMQKIKARNAKIVNWCIGLGYGVCFITGCYLGLKGNPYGMASCFCTAFLLSVTHTVHLYLK